MVYFQSFNFKNFYIWLPKTDISLWWKSGEPFLRYSAKTLKNLLFFQMSPFDDTIKSTWRWRHQKFLSICNYFYPYYTLTKFHPLLTWNSEVKIWTKMPPPPPPPRLSLFRLAKSPVQIGLRKLQPMVISNCRGGHGGRHVLHKNSVSEPLQGESGWACYHMTKRQVIFLELTILRYPS